MKDPDLARLFENTFPSTLDTTVKYFDPDLDLAFIITGVRPLTLMRVPISDSNSPRISSEAAPDESDSSLTLHVYQVHNGFVIQLIRCEWVRLIDFCSTEPHFLTVVRTLSPTSSQRPGSPSTRESRNT
jgi:hypothetical protein